MRTNQKPTGRAMSLPAGLCAGACVSTGITLLFTLALAKLLDLEIMQWEQIGYGIMVLLIAASFMGTVVSCNRIKRRRLLVCVLSGMLYFGILLSVTALFFDGQYEAVGITALLILAGSGCAGLLKQGTKRGGKNRRQCKYKQRIP